MPDTRYFLSGASGIRPEVMPLVASHVDYRLLSMHSAFKGNTKVWCAVMADKRCAIKEVMLDSGAFTAFTKGHKVTLDELVPVYRDTERKILNAKSKTKLWFINLDVIPGEYGRKSEPHEIAEAVAQSDVNFKQLKKIFGDRVLPVWHQTETEARLIDVCKQNDYIAMGFRQDLAEHARIRCAQEVLAEIANPKGIRVHGLATTGYKMLDRTTFWSVDSASWLYAAAMGKILHIDQQGELEVIDISNESPARKKDRGHFNSIPEDHQALVLERIAAAGTTIKQAQSDLSYRILICAHQMQEWVNHHYKAPKTIVYEKGFFPV